MIHLQRLDLSMGLAEVPIRLFQFVLQLCNILAILLLELVEPTFKIFNVLDLLIQLLFQLFLIIEELFYLSGRLLRELER